MLNWSWGCLEQKNHLCLIACSDVVSSPLGRLQIPVYFCSSAGYLQMKGHYFIQAVTCIIHIFYRKQQYIKKGSYLSFCYIVLLNIILRVAGFKNLSFWNLETIKLNIHSTIINIYLIIIILSIIGHIFKNQYIKKN